MKRLLTLVALAASSAPLTLAATAEHRWFADYDQAVAAAKAEGKDLLVDFTGSDWCGWCIKLHDEVFKHDAFYDAASKQFVLVALDFPNGEEAKAKVPNPERNRELSEKHGIQGFPTVLLMNADGEVFGSTGYRPDGPEKYVAYLGQLATSGKALVAAGKTLPAEYEAATDKAAVVKKALELMLGAVEGAAGADAVAGVVRHAFTLDPKDEQGLKSQALEGLFKAGVAVADDFAVAFELDPKNERGLKEKAVLGQFGLVQDDTTATAAVDGLIALFEGGTLHDKESLKKATYNAILWCVNAELLGRPEDAKKLLGFAETLGEVPQSIRDAVKG